MPWLINEAAAVKAKVAGLTVTDANAPSGRPVEVRFRTPEYELADLTYPNIIIEMTNLRRASEREHRSGPIFLDYVPDGYSGTLLVMDPDTGQRVEWDETSDLPGPYLAADFPIPYDMDFQITVNARFQNHIYQLMAELAQPQCIPERFGYIQVPEDGTIRSLFLMGGPEFTSRRDPDGKRIFSAVYAVRVATELPPLVSENLVTYVNSVNFILDLIGPLVKFGLDDTGLTDSIILKYPHAVFSDNAGLTDSVTTTLT